VGRQRPPSTRSRAALFVFFYLLSAGKKQKACHSLLVTVFAIWVVYQLKELLTGCLLELLCCKNCASLRSSGTQTVMKKRLCGSAGILFKVYSQNLKLK
jgi:hypothetical protein